MNNFILNYNPFSQFPRSGQLLTLLRINRHVSQFYQPFHGTYLIKSMDVASVVNDSFKGIFESTPYILTQLFSHVAAGSLPPEVWQWINFDTVPAPPSSIPVLDALRRYGTREID